MNELVLFFIAFLSFVIGSLATMFFIAYKLHREAKEISIAAQDALNNLKQSIIPCRIEIVDDTIFMYRRDTDLFLTKGLTLKEMEVDLKKRFPDNYFDVKQEEIDEAKVMSLFNERKNNVRSG